MIFRRANKMTKEIKNKMQEYGILKFEKDYAFRISKGSKSKIENLSYSEAAELLSELTLWTKEYIIDNIYGLLNLINPKLFPAQTKPNDLLAYEFIIIASGKDKSQIKNIKRLSDFHYLDLLLLADSASAIYLQQRTRLN